MQQEDAASNSALYDIEAEICVIGSILIDGKAIHSVAGYLDAQHFHSESNRYIYESCIELLREGAEIDQQTLRSRLEVNGHLDDAGGDAFLSAAVASVPHSLHIRSYADTVVSMATLRQLADAGQRVTEIGSDPTRAKDADAAVKEAEDILFRIGATAATQDFVLLREAPTISDYFEPPDTDQDGAAENAPVPTGIESIDAELGGLHRSDLIVLAARPGFGKSTLALNCALNAAKRNYKVGIFSIEMGIDQIAHRMAACHAKVDITSIRRGQFTTDEQARISDAYALFSDIVVFVDDSPIQTIAAMSSKARRQKMLHGLDFLIVDYMQLISGSPTGGDGNRVQEVSEISRNLKAIARDLNVPVLACSQLNRAVEHRRTQEPRLSDLRESGSIEQDADIVMFIHRDDKNMSEDEWNRRNPTQPYPSGLADIIIAKHRHGPTGTVKMAAIDNLGLFTSIAEMN